MANACEAGMMSRKSGQRALSSSSQLLLMLSAPALSTSTGSQLLLSAPPQAVSSSFQLLLRLLAPPLRS